MKNAEKFTALIIEDYVQERDYSLSSFEELREKSELFEEPDRSAFLLAVVEKLLRLSLYGQYDNLKSLQSALSAIDQMAEGELKEAALEKFLSSANLRRAYNGNKLQEIVFISKKVSSALQKRFFRHSLAAFKEMLEVETVKQISKLLGKNLPIAEERILLLKSLKEQLLSSKDKAAVSMEMKNLAVLLPDEDKDFWLDVILKNYYSPEIAMFLAEEKRDQKLKDYFNSSLKEKKYQECLNLVTISPESLRSDMAKELFLDKDARVKNLRDFYGPISNFSVYFQFSAFLPEQERISFLEDALINWYNDRHWWKELKMFTLVTEREKIEAATTERIDPSADDNNTDEETDNYAECQDWDDTEDSECVVDPDDSIESCYPAYLIAFKCADKLLDPGCKNAWLKMIRSGLFNNLEQLDLSFIPKTKEDIISLEISDLGDGTEIFDYLDEDGKSLLAEKIINYCLKSIPYFLSDQSYNSNGLTEKAKGDSKKYFEAVLSLLKFLGQKKSDRYVVKMAGLFEMAPSWLLGIHTLNKKIDLLIDKLKSVASLKGPGLTTEDKKFFLGIIGDIITDEEVILPENDTNMSDPAYVIKLSSDDVCGSVFEFMSKNGISAAYKALIKQDVKMADILLSWLKAGMTDEESKRLDPFMNSNFNHYYSWRGHVVAYESYGRDCLRTLCFKKFGE